MFVCVCVCVFVYIYIYVCVCGGGGGMSDGLSELVGGKIGSRVIIYFSINRAWLFKEECKLERFDPTK